ncbi:MAG: protein kinase, partial [Desulfobulbaceae bacterium]|nr:protein kinase [Desulfobulbaceae bacterium]
LITKNALLKITDFGILLDLGDPGFEDIDDSIWGEGDSEATVGFRGTPAFASPEQIRDSHDVDERTDIFSFGLCMWLMLCGRKPFKKNIEKNVIPEPTPLNPKDVFPPVLCDLLKKCVAYDPDDRFVNFAKLREAINEAYQAFFKVSCPYAVLDDIDLRADGLNNRAVSYFELGRTKEAEKWLIQTLEINDTLPEAVHNMFLHKWRKGAAQSDRLIRQIEATKKSRPKITWLDELEEAVRNDLAREETPGGQPVKFPEFRLCVPKKSLEIFRESQMYKSIQRNVMDHFENRRYDACYKVLLKAWKNIGFRKDKVFTGIYERLLQFADRGEVQGWQRLMNMKGSATPVTCLERIPGSRKIVMAGSDGKIVIRDFSAMKKLDILGTDDSPVRSVAVSPKGQYLAVGNEEGRVSIWSVKSGKSISHEAAHRGPVLSLAFSPNGKMLASGGSDGIMKLRNPFQKGMESSVSLRNSGAVRAITFFESGEEMVTGSDDGTIRFWSAGASECQRIVEAHALPVVTLSVSPDGQKFVSGSADRLIKIWDKHSARTTKVIEAHGESVTSVLMLEDNKSVISGCEDDILKLWDVKSGDCLLTLDGRGDGICSLAPAHKSHIFLAGKHDGSVLFVMVIYQLSFD